MFVTLGMSIANGSAEINGADEDVELKLTANGYHDDNLDNHHLENNGFPLTGNGIAKIARNGCASKLKHQLGMSLFFNIYSQLQVESRSSKCPSVRPSVRPYHYISCSFYRILSISHTGHHYNVVGVMEETSFFFGSFSGRFLPFLG